jgi:hypothetical protein
MTLEVKDLVGCLGEFRHGPDFLGEPAANKKTTLGNFPLVVIHGDDVGVFDQKGSHFVVCGEGLAIGLVV